MVLYLVSTQEKVYRVHAINVVTSTYHAYKPCFKDKQIEKFVWHAKDRVVLQKHYNYAHGWVNILGNNKVSIAHAYADQVQSSDVFVQVKVFKFKFFTLFWAHQPNLSSHETTNVHEKAYEAVNYCPGVSLAKNISDK